MENEIILEGNKIKYKLFKRNVKYARLEFRSGELFVITPFWYKNVDYLLKKKSKWIINKISKLKDITKNSLQKKLIFRDYNKWKEVVYKIANQYSKELNLYYKNIYFKTMIGKWGSCSYKGNITINNNLQYLPLNLLRYILYHEILHLKIKKHNKFFFEILNRKFKDVKKIEKELFEYWFAVRNNI